MTAMQAAAQIERGQADIIPKGHTDHIPSWIRKSVVTITGYVTTDGSYAKKIGSGFIYHPNGYIATRLKVVENCSKIFVRLEDGSKRPAEVIYSNPVNGMALVKIAGSEYKPVLVGNSEELNSYSILTIIGNSLGIFPSMTLASLKERDQQGLLKLQAFIPPGNCGSPIFDEEGRLVAVVMGRILGSNRNHSIKGGIGVAMPVESFSGDLDEMVRYLNENRGWVGITADDLPGTHWIVVHELTKGGPAQKAGICVGDTITAFEGQQFYNLNELRLTVRKVIPGTKVVFTLKKGSMEITHLVTVEEKR